jgi:hypothetical protein
VFTLAGTCNRDSQLIEAAARNLMRRFGEDASRQADICIKELEERGEAAGLDFGGALAL